MFLKKKKELVNELNEKLEKVKAKEREEKAHIDDDVIDLEADE